MSSYPVMQEPKHTFFASWQGSGSFGLMSAYSDFAKLYGYCAVISFCIEKRERIWASS